ncbi:MAG: 50S ribosomal protein L31e [Candidatus Altiarchaeales archaeon]|nr:MAG: 50S ribosomal protein L31e [Candidatus Altiarchaeales archaeon]
MERIYTIPLRNAFVRRKKTNSAVNIIREFLRKHTKSDNIVIDGSINDMIWRRGIKSIPRKIKVRVEKEEDRVIAMLAE